MTVIHQEYGYMDAQIYITYSTKKTNIGKNEISLLMR